MIATTSQKAYLVSMLAARFMLILALLVAPLGMWGGPSMALTPSASASSEQQSADHATHCAEMAGENEGPSDRGSSQSDCLSDCAMACSAIAAPGSRIAERKVGAAVIDANSPIDTLHGLNPESADPPPRTA
ncbi:hypothetical protein ACWPM1_13335 [Tsuneonella sp. HG249]